MLKSEIVSPAMTYEALVDVDDAHLGNVSNLGLHTNHEVAKCIMSAKGDNTSFPPSFLSILFYRF